MTPGRSRGEEAPFRVGSVALDRSNTSFTLTWESALGQRFGVLRSTNLEDWTPIATNYPSEGADGAATSFTDAAPPPGATFYRVSRPINPTAKMNVLLMLVDDLRDHEAFAGSNRVFMPNLDRLAAEGMKFNRAFCQATFCNPSRSSFLTGLRPNTTGIHNNQDFFRNSPDLAVANAITLPQCFRSNGYYTASLGKVLHDPFVDPPSWVLQTNTFPSTATGNTGTSNNMTGGKLSWCWWRAPDCEDEDLGDGAMARMAVEMLQQKRTEPFFLALGFRKPHDPFVAPKKYFDLYPLTNLVLHVDPPDATPAPPLAVPNNATKQAFDAMSDSNRLDFLRCYAACSTYTDRQIGKILDAMDRLGLWQNTIVVAYSDHGYHQGERGWWNKTLLFDYDAKVTFLAYVPQMPRRSVICSRVIELVDVYPTLTALAGIVPPATLEGRSFAPLLYDPTAPWNYVAYSQSGAGANVSVRNERFRYTEWSDGAAELYDHDTDPGEWYNLSTNAAFSNVVAELKALLPTRMGTTNIPGLIWEPFDYGNNQALGNRNGGVGWAGSWSELSSGGDPAISTNGDLLFIEADGNQQYINDLTGKRLFTDKTNNPSLNATRSFSPKTGTVWMSFLTANTVGNNQHFVECGPTTNDYVRLANGATDKSYMVINGVHLTNALVFGTSTNTYLSVLKLETDVDGTVNDRLTWWAFQSNVDSLSSTNEAGLGAPLISYGGEDIWGGSIQNVYLRMDSSANDVSGSPLFDNLRISYGMDNDDMVATVLGMMPPETGTLGIRGLTE